MRNALIIVLIASSWLHFLYGQETESPDSAGQKRKDVEFFPILSYDTDVGFGYGVKAFFLDHFSLSESFDLVLFHSTKGERWYRLVASFPDIELRQRTLYPLALDFLIDYDKLVNANYFGVGNSSSYTTRETYTKTPLEISITAGRGFTPTVVGQVVLRYRSIRISSIDPLGNLALQMRTSTPRATSISLVLSLRYDTRNSFVNPTTGTVVLGEGEWAPQWSSSTTSFSRFAFFTQGYIPLHGIVFAGRLGVQQIYGKNLPLQILLPIGGVNSLRGYPQDRFLDRASIIINFETRFILLWRLAGVAGWDIGKVWSSLGKADLVSWPNNLTVGLRLIMDNFVVRFDLGFSRETTGLYLNFGQLF